MGRFAYLLIKSGFNGFNVSEALNIETNLSVFSTLILCIENLQILRANFGFKASSRGK